MRQLNRSPLTSSRITCCYVTEVGAAYNSTKLMHNDLALMPIPFCHSYRPRAPADNSKGLNEKPMRYKAVGLSLAAYWFQVNDMIPDSIEPVSM